jgi:myo-inositol-1(or 4)-monophosphatase
VVDLEERFAAGAAVIAEAGTIARGFFDRRRDLQVELKCAQDLVSIADREVEHAIAQELRARFPEDAILGEEHGLQGSGRAVWLVDPIDGTTNFVRGIAYWCVSIGLLVDGVPTLGFVYDPMQDELFTARRGGSAHCNGRIMRASRAEPAHGRVSIGFTIRQPIERLVAVARGLVAEGCEFGRYGSAALSLAYVADGRLEGFWAPDVQSWDVCAGLVLCGEAGAVVDPFFTGKNPHATGPCLVAGRGVEQALRRATRMPRS